MQIIKSNNTKQQFSPNKIMRRIKDQSKGLNVGIAKIFQNCVSGIVDGMTTKEVDNLIAITAANMIIEDPDYSYFAARIILTRQGKLIGVEPIDSDYLFDFVGITSFLYKYSDRNDKEEPIELPHMMYKRVAKHLHGKDYLRYYNRLRWREISLATPILMNSGIEGRGNLISCNLSTLEFDSTEGILSTIDEASLASRDGAGIGLHIHNLRSKDSLVSSFKGNAGGVVRFADMVQSHMRFFKQGKRSGSAALYLGIWHRDIEEFLELRLPTGDEKMRTRDLFTAVSIPDLFMEKLNSGNDDWYVFCPHEVEKAGFVGLHEVWGDDWKQLYDDLVYHHNNVDDSFGKKLSVRELWNMIVKSLVESGLPYVNYWDNMNRHNPQSNIGIRTGSNLCVTPDTKILTDKGQVPIGTLEGEKVIVWNGEEWSETTVMKTGIDKDIVRVTTNSGQTLDCTLEHNFYTVEKYSNGKINKVAAKDLKAGDKLLKSKFPIISEGVKVLDNAYQNGFFTGDGCSYKGDNIIYLYHEKMDLLPVFKDDASYVNLQENQKRITIKYPDLQDKFFIPSCEYTLRSRLEWLAGFLDADGVVTNNNGSQSIQVTSVNLEFLKELQLFLQTLGCNTRISNFREKGKYLLPANDGSGENKLFDCKSAYRLLINGNSLYTLSLLGFKTKRLSWIANKPNRECSHFVKVESVVELPEVSDTFCFKEEKRGMGVFNGILTGQCHEIMQVTKPNYTAQCCLALIPLGNLKKNDFKSVRDAVVDTVITLNKVIDLNVWSNDSCKNAGEDQRAIAIGIAGLSDYLQNHGIPYYSDEAKEFNRTLMRTIYQTAKETSSQLAVEVYNKSYPAWDGSIYDFENTPMANSLLVGLMPSASTSVLLGMTESFEAPHSNIFVRKLDVGEFTLVNKYLVRDLKELGLWNSDVINNIIANKGSIQHIEAIPDNIKEVYKTIWEVGMKNYIEIAAIRQEWIDQSQSMNLYFSDPTTGKIGGALNFAWKSGLPTGSYYTKTRSALSAPTRLAISDTSVSNAGLPPKPENSDFDCFGCSA